MTFYLGVDAGASKTAALVVDHTGAVRGHGKTGNGNYQLNYDEAKKNIREAVMTALSSAGIKQDQVTSALFGLAGADRALDYRILNDMIHKLKFPRFRVVCDTIIAMRAGTNRHYGIVLLCGTGVNCAGRNQAGKELQIGGFDYMYGDFGGGKWLAIEMFRAVVRSWEGRGRSTKLTEKMLTFLGYTDVEKMYHDYLDQHKTEVPIDIVPLLFESASEGDSVAKEILASQGEELGVTAKAVIRRLRMEDCEFDVVLAGSILTQGKGDFIFNPIKQHVLEVAPLANVKRLVFDPVIGAVMGAMDDAKQPIREEALANLLNYSFE